MAAPTLTRVKTKKFCKTYPAFIRGADKPLAVVVESKRRHVVPFDTQTEIPWFWVSDGVSMVEWDKARKG